MSWAVRPVAGSFVYRVNASSPSDPRSIARTAFVRPAVTSERAAARSVAVVMTTASWVDGDAPAAPVDGVAFSRVRSVGAGSAARSLAPT